MKRTVSILLLFVLVVTLSAQTRDNYLSYLRNRDVKIDKTNLPIVFINTNNTMIQRDNYILAQMKIIHNGDGRTNFGDTVSYIGQSVDYEGYIALKYRGNSSFTESNKKPLAFRTLESNVLPDDGGKKKKVKILGMEKDNKWGFIAPWCDETMFRDILSFELGRPWFDWVPSARLCEIILDGTYYGVYVLCERVSKGKHRLNLNDPTVDDKGQVVLDFHVSVDHGYDPYYASKNRPWQSMDGSRESHYTIKYEYEDPEDDEFSDLPNGTREALHAEIDKMENAFKTTNWQDPDNGYRKLVDEISFIDYLLATEVSMNIDGYRLSTHLYKHSEQRQATEEIDPRWKTTLWDYNIAWGNANYYGGERTDLWQYEFNINNTGDDCPVPFYWYKMLIDPAFKDQIKLRWQEYRQSNHSNERIMQTVDSLSNLLTEKGAAERNEQAWAIYNRSNIWPIPYYAKNYTQAVNYLKNWIQQRLLFLDRYLLPPRVISTVPVPIYRGWNADIVAENLPAVNYSSVTIDASDRAFYSEELRDNGGLPTNRMIISANEDVKYELAPYTDMNALSLHSYGESGTLEFDNPIETCELFILGTSGNGQSVVSIDLNYANGETVHAGQYSIRDWSVRNPQGDEAVSGLGNIRRGENAFSSDNHYCLFDFSVPVDESRLLSSVTFTSESNAYASIMALSQIEEQATGIAESQTSPCRIQNHRVYDLQGRASTTRDITKGIRLVRQQDGTFRKVIKK